MEGQIIKGIGGLYSVTYGDEVYLCKARGKLRNEKLTPIIGDQVIFDIQSDGKGTIEDILERKNSLIRPAVSNIDKVILVFSLKNPDINYSVLDKFLVMIEKANLDACICINKVDLSSQDDLDKFKDVYSLAGYEVIFVSAKENKSIEGLKQIMKDKVVAFAGPSGVGKSSLLNKIQEGLKLQTGDISEKTSRGKHTTRSVELFKMDFGGYVLDTPGFTSLEIEDIKATELKHYFREMEQYTGDCKYTSCVHITEDSCAVKDAVEKEKISKARYNSYIGLYGELASRKVEYRKAQDDKRSGSQEVRRPGKRR